MTFHTSADRDTALRALDKIIDPRSGKGLAAAGLVLIGNEARGLIEQSNPRTFARRFRAATGRSALDYVVTLRIEEAKQALESEETPVDDIALRRLKKRRLLLRDRIARLEAEIDPPEPA